MKISKMYLAAVTFVLLSGPFSAQANLIWIWTGDCQQILQGNVPLCAHAAMLVVTTDAYIPGEVFSFLDLTEPTTSPLLEALYADDNVTIDFALRFNGPNGFAFMFPASPSEGGFISGEEFSFHSCPCAWMPTSATGVWETGSEGVLPEPYIAAGDNGVWRVPEPRVPAPSTLVLLGVGLAGLAFSRRRKVS